jgi:hypothetical protein
MKVVGFATAYSIVPLLESEDTEDGHVMVDFASTLVEIELDPKKGSFLPHW